MKTTSEDLAKAMGLKVGDKIKLKNGEIAEVIEDYDLWFESSELKRFGLHILIDEEYEILPPEKTKEKVGNLLCDEVGCADCPLERCCWDIPVETLYENLERWNDKYNDKEIYDILKARLDKEVNDEK